MNKRQLLRTGAVALAAFALAGAGQAQDFPPKKAVTMLSDSFLAIRRAATSPTSWWPTAPPTARRSCSARSGR